MGSVEDVVALAEEAVVMVETVVAVATVMEAVSVEVVVAPAVVVEEVPHPVEIAMVFLIQSLKLSCTKDN